jgi:hypothetical protein
LRLVCCGERIWLDPTLLERIATFGERQPKQADELAPMQLR